VANSDGLTGLDKGRNEANPERAKPVSGRTAARESKRERKQRRREMQRREAEQARLGRSKRDQKFDEMLESIEWMLPNVTQVLREHHSRSP
jgi:hypothetical protein